MLTPLLLIVLGKIPVCSVS